ncbi:MAG: hypothetical protein KDC87_12365 [Planctomycetes bacterium]|nr:hypothetical protein [Planctomycetota bacterium]
MQDDDEEATGKLFYSGINPDADRAEYALPRGVPALQDGEPEVEPEDDGCADERPCSADQQLVSTPPTRGAAQRTWSRRWLLGAGAIGGGLVLVGAGVAAWVGRDGARRVVPSNPFPEDAGWLVRGARTAALGDLRDLVGTYGTYLMVVELYGKGDDLLWQGVDRLGRYALLDGGQRGAEIAKQMLATFQHAPPPRHLQSLALELQAFLDRRARRERRVR